MTELNHLPNIGKVLAKNLNLIGISKPQDLKSKGTERIILELLTIPHHGVCINMVYAIEGAIQGIRWHGLSVERKNELKEFYKSLRLNDSAS